MFTAVRNPEPIPGPYEAQGRACSGFKGLNGNAPATPATAWLAISRFAGSFTPIACCATSVPIWATGAAATLAATGKTALATLFTAAGIAVLIPSAVLSVVATSLMFLALCTRPASGSWCG